MPSSRSGHPAVIGCMVTERRRHGEAIVAATWTELVGVTVEVAALDSPERSQNGSPRRRRDRRNHAAGDHVDRARLVRSPMSSADGCSSPTTGRCPSISVSILDAHRSPVDPGARAGGTGARASRKPATSDGSNPSCSTPRTSSPSSGPTCASSTRARRSRPFSAAHPTGSSDACRVNSCIPMTWRRPRRS